MDFKGDRVEVILKQRRTISGRRHRLILGKDFHIDFSGAGLHEATAAADAEGVRTILEVAIVRLFGPKILHMLKPHIPKLIRKG